MVQISWWLVDIVQYVAAQFRYVGGRTSVEVWVVGALIYWENSTLRILEATFILNIFLF